MSPTRRKPAPADLSAALTVAAGVLDGSGDLSESLALFARRAMDRCADFCAVEIADAPGPPRLRALASRDPDRDARLRLLWSRRRFSGGPLDTRGVMASGVPEVVRRVAPTSDDADGPDAVFFRELKPAATLTAPVKARGKSIGALALARTRRGGPAFDPDMVRAAEEVAFRIALLAEIDHFRRQAEETVADRQRFLSIASHELRTPLIAMRLSVEGLERSLLPGSEEVRRSVEAVRREAQRMDALIRNLLDVSLIQQGRLVRARIRTDLVELVNGVVARLRPELDHSGSAVSVCGPTSAVGMWDPSLLDQVVTNLVANAAKYGRGRPIQIDIGWAEGWVSLEVRDQGDGIRTEDVPRLFHPFERGSLPQRVPGLGLGLFIVRRIVEAHGGSVVVRSEPGAGSTFRVELPA